MTRAVLALLSRFSSTEGDLCAMREAQRRRFVGFMPVGGPTRPGEELSERGGRKGGLSTRHVDVHAGVVHAALP